MKKLIGPEHSRVLREVDKISLYHNTDWSTVPWNSDSYVLAAAWKPGIIILWCEGTYWVQLDTWEVV